jgi:uncharacterized protein YqhQ
MIRDEFKNADKKVINEKANKKRQQMGDRAYFAKKLSLYNEILKPISFSTIFCTVCFFLMGALFFAEAVITKEFDARAIIFTVLAVLFIIWCCVWFLVVSKKIKQKAQYYKDEMARQSREYVLKYKR